jgi:predicted N-formylglutamate amidohydrolase
MIRPVDETIRRHGDPPANRTADGVEKAKSRRGVSRAYHNALTDLAARQDDTAIIAIHSFTPRLGGRSPRPWHIGILQFDSEFVGPAVRFAAR